MHKITLSLAFLAGILFFSSCGTTQSGSVLGSLGQNVLNNNGGSNVTTQTQSSVSEAGSLLGNLLSGILEGSTTLSQSSLQGTWKYVSSDCVFESENLLAKAGGAVAATKIEENLNTQLSKVGIGASTCAFTFNSDGTYSAKIGSRTVNGNYTLDAANKTMKLTYLGGLANYSTRVVLSGGKLSLLIESDKLLALMKGISAFNNNSNVSSLSSLLSSYDGMYVGIQMSK